jgi:hypothetical protein
MTSDEQFQEGVAQITDLAHQFAAEQGVKLSAVTFDDNRPPGGSGIHMIYLTSKTLTAHTKLSQEEIEDYSGRAGSDLTRAKIRSVIERLKLMLEG